MECIQARHVDRRARFRGCSGVEIDWSSRRHVAIPWRLTFVPMSVSTLSRSTGGVISGLTAPCMYSAFYSGPFRRPTTCVISPLRTIHHNLGRIGFDVESKWREMAVVKLGLAERPPRTCAFHGHARFVDLSLCQKKLNLCCCT